MKLKTSLYNLITILALSSSLILSQVPKPDHVVVVIFENHSFGQIVGSKDAPYLNSLIEDSSTALFTNSFAVAHPSQPNYLALFCGSGMEVNGDEMPENLPFTTANLGAELLRKGYTFSGYCESLPSVGYNGKFYDGITYARKHNPWVNWQGAKQNAIPDSLNKRFLDFPKSYNQLPDVSFVIPNQYHDMHSGESSGRVSKGDSWLKESLSDYVKWAKKHNSILIITFDEDNTKHGNHITTLFTGEQVKGGKYDERINHFDVLKTLEDMYNLPYAGASKNAKTIKDCWKK